MSDGIISIDVELNEKEFQTSLANMGDIVQSGSEAMIKSVNTLGNNFSMLPHSIDTAFKSVPFLISRLINNIASNNPVMAETGSNLFNSLADNIPEAASNISGRMPEISSSIIDKLTSFYPEISNTGRSFFSSLTNELPDAVSDILEEVPQIASDISDRINEDRQLMADAGFNLFASLTEDLPYAIKHIEKAPREITDTVINAFKGLLYKFNDIGANIVQGVWSGISSMASWLGSKVSGFFQGIVGGVTSFLGIRSPSTLFKDKIGRNIALGIGAGIAEEMPGVANDMLKYINAVVDNAERGANKININGFAGSAFSSRNADANIRNGDFKDNTGIINDSPAVNITIEPAADIRGFFEYLSMNIKRADYLGGGAGI